MNHKIEARCGEAFPITVRRSGGNVYLPVRADIDHPGIGSITGEVGMPAIGFGKSPDQAIENAQEAFNRLCSCVVACSLTCDIKDM